MHRLFPFSSRSTTSGSGATAATNQPTSSSSSTPKPPIDRRQSLDAYRPLAERLRSHLSQVSTGDGQGSTVASSLSTAAESTATVQTTATSITGGGKLRRSTSASSFHSSGSNGQRSKHKLKNLWHRVSGSVTSIPGAFLGGGSLENKTNESAKPKEDQVPATASKDATPQVIYFMGNRPSTEALAPTPSSSDTPTATPQQPQSRHAKLLSMVDEGAEDDEEDSSSDEEDSSSDEEDEEDLQSGETTAVNSPAPNTHGAPLPSASGAPLTQRPATRYVDPFASPAVAPISVPPNSPEAPTNAALPSFGQVTSAADRAPTSFASFLGLAGSSSKPPFFFSKSAGATPTEGEKPKVDPEALAQRIQELIDALPPPPIFAEIPQTPYPPTPYPPETPGGEYPASPFPSRLPPPPKPRVPKRDTKTGRPIPPADAVPEGVDEEVVKLLWSVSVMGDQALPEDEGEEVPGDEGKEGTPEGDTGKDGGETEKPTEPLPTHPGSDERQRRPSHPPGTPRRRFPGSPRHRHPRTPGGPRTPGPRTRNIWQILEGYSTSGHIPPTPYTGIGSGGAPGSVIPLPPVEEDEVDLGGDENKDMGEGEEGRRVDDDTHNGGGGESETVRNDLFSDGGSVMLYSPLIPGLHDLVEMGNVVDVLWEEDYEEDEADEDALVEDGGYQPVPAPSTTDDVSGKGKGRGWVPSLGWWSSSSTSTAAPTQEDEDKTPSPTLSAYGSPTTGVSSALTRAVAGSGSVHKRQGRTTVNAEGKVVTRRVRRVVVAEQAWTPSKDKMSVQVFWWGYRLCLPPPTLAILSDKTIEATKRAAMITTALTWFLQNVPVTALPLPLQPTVLLLQRLAPYLGYVGTFISWSWQQIKSYDKGKGVLLTATWLLPIALIPGTWFDHSFPEPPPALPAPCPAPAPAPTPTPGGPVKTPTSGKPPAETPTPATPTPPAPVEDPVPPPPHQPPVQIINPTVTPDEEEVVEAKGGKRTRKTSLTQTIAAFVSRKAKIPSRSRKNSTSASIPPTTSTAKGKEGEKPPSAAPVAQVSRISSTSTSMTSPMVSVGGLPPAHRQASSSSSSPLASSATTSITVTGVDGEDTVTEAPSSPALSNYATPPTSPVAFPSAIAGGAQSFAALAESSTPIGMTTPMPTPTSAGFVASGMLSPLTPGILPPTPAAVPPSGSSYLPSPPDSPAPSTSTKTASNKLKKRNSLSARPPEPTRKPTLGMNAVHPDSELGQELVKSWRVGTVDLPVSPSVEKLKGGEEVAAKAKDKGEAGVGKEVKEGE